jgi:coenzyme F420-reducing hydrogenase beta subunit
MIEKVRAHVAEKIKELDGVVALRQTDDGAVAPYLFRQGDDLSQLALEPLYPLASTVSLLQKQHPQARLGIVARGCDARALVEMSKREQVDAERLYLLGMACSAEKAGEC